MPRTLIVGCRQEVSTFDPVPSRYEDFRLVAGIDLIDQHRGGREELGGARGCSKAAA